jgi:hypothetical protein
MKEFVQMYQEKYMRFPQGKQKALTFSYDDGVEADKRLIELFNRYGLKGTFNLNSRRFDIAPQWHGRMNEEETFKTFANCGQEIASHGAMHAFLDKVSLPEAICEVVDCRKYLEEKFGRIVSGYAYAYNGYNDEVVSFLKSFGITYARTTEASLSFDIPTDWLRLKPTCHHSREGMLNTLADKFFNHSPSESVKQREPWLFYVWGHSFEFDENNNWNIIEDFAARAYNHAEEVWFATNGEVYEYVQAYNRLVFSCNGEQVYNPSAKNVWIELRGKTYCIKSGATLKFDSVK